MVKKRHTAKTRRYPAQFRYSIVFAGLLSGLLIITTFVAAALDNTEIRSKAVSPAMPIYSCDPSTNPPKTCPTGYKCLQTLQYPPRPGRCVADVSSEPTSSVSLVIKEGTVRYEKPFGSREPVFLLVARDATYKLVSAVSGPSVDSRMKRPTEPVVNLKEYVGKQVRVKGTVLWGDPPPWMRLFKLVTPVFTVYSIEIVDLSVTPTRMPSLVPDRGNVGRGKMCIQVITGARNSESGECRMFSTPCDVPSGWVADRSCGS